MEAKINEQNKKIFLQDLGMRIRKVRKQKGMTQLELAVKTHSDKRKVGGLERGEYNFRISSLMVIANGLDVSVESLLNVQLLNKLKSTIWLHKE